MRSGGATLIAATILLAGCAAPAAEEDGPAPATPPAASAVDAAAVAAFLAGIEKLDRTFAGDRIGLVIHHNGTGEPEGEPEDPSSIPVSPERLFLRVLYDRPSQAFLFRVELTTEGETYVLGHAQRGKAAHVFGVNGAFLARDERPEMPADILEFMDEEGRGQLLESLGEILTLEGMDIADDVPVTHKGRAALRIDVSNATATGSLVAYLDPLRLAEITSVSRDDPARENVRIEILYDQEVQVAIDAAAPRTSFSSSLDSRSTYSDRNECGTERFASGEEVWECFQGVVPPVDDEVRLEEIEIQLVVPAYEKSDLERCEEWYLHENDTEPAGRECYVVESHDDPRRCPPQTLCSSSTSMNGENPVTVPRKVLASMRLDEGSLAIGNHSFEFRDADADGLLSRGDSWRVVTNETRVDGRSVDVEFYDLWAELPTGQPNVEIPAAPLGGLVLLVVALALARKRHA